MKILYVTLGLPHPPMAGAQRRDFELYRRIAQQHSLQVVALTESQPEAAHASWLGRFVERVHPMVMPTALSGHLLRRLPAHLLNARPLATLPFVEQRILQRIETLARDWRPDLVQIEHSFLAPYADAIPQGCRKVLSLHNIGERQYQRLPQIAASFQEELAARCKAWTMRGWEADQARRFDRIVTVSDDDREHLLAQDPSLPIDVIPNGVDTQSLLPFPPVSGHKLLFVGNLTYPPNVDAVHHFCDVVFPRIQRVIPEATFTAAGLEPPPSLLALGKRSGVSIAASPADLTPYYEQASVCVVPLRAGGGTRLKILEAMALARPVVSTAIGSEGLALRDGEDLLIADGPDAFAAAVIDLLQNRDRARQLAATARRRAEDLYDWDKLAVDLNSIYAIIGR